MAKRKIIGLLILSIFVLSILIACGQSLRSTTATEVQTETSAASTEIAVPAATTATTIVHSADHADAADYAWDSAAVIPITLQGDVITVDGEGATVEGSQVTIRAAGTYSISGSLTDGQIIVDTQDEELVRLILNGVAIHSATGAPIAVMDAEETIIWLADNTENFLTDGDVYVFADPAEDEPNAALFSKSALTIAGSGSLTVVGNYNDGIASKDGLIIASGTITVNAVDDGIRGKDYLVVNAGNITVNAQGDGLKADNEEDATKGDISVATGMIQITAGGDAITAESDVIITAGEFTLSSGGGSGGSIDESTSAKGIKAGSGITIDGGTLNITSADDAVHANVSITINGGTLTLATGDDGIHADATVTVNGGDIAITDSYEGIESAIVTINAGEIHLTSSDDGLNVAGGNETTATTGGQAAGRGQDRFANAGNNYLYINGGYIVIDAAGDGIDANGAITMTDGVVIVNGPTARMNGAVDYDASFTMTGGFLVAVGSSGMAAAPDESSSQYAVLLNFDTTQPAGTLIHLQNSAGEGILTFAPTKEYQSIAFAAPALVNGETYQVYTGGTATGTASDGLYQDATYTPGTAYTSFTVTGMITRLGNSARR